MIGLSSCNNVIVNSDVAWEMNKITTLRPVKEDLMSFRRVAVKLNIFAFHKSCFFNRH